MRGRHSCLYIYLLQQLPRGPQLTIYTPSFKAWLALLSTLTITILQKVKLPEVMFYTEDLVSPRNFCVCALRSQLPCKKLPILRRLYHEEAQAVIYMLEEERRSWSTACW